MYPEAGGSSIVRPARLQRVLVLLRGVGPDAQLHHHGRDLGVLRAALPRGLLGAARRVARATSSAASSWSSLLGVLNVVGVKEAAGREHLPRGRRLPDPGPARGRGRRARALARDAGAERGLRHHADRGRLPDRDPGRRWSPTPASRRSRTWPRRRATTARRSRAASGGVVVAVVGHLRVPAGGGAVGDAGRERRDAARAVEGGRRLRRTTRCWAWWRTWTWARSRAPAEIYVGVLAATILFIATNAGLIGVSRLTLLDGPVPPAARAAARSCTRGSARPTWRSWCSALIACLTILPGQADFLGTIYAFGAMLSFTIAHLAVIALRDQASPTRAAVARAGRPQRCAGASCRCSRCSAGSARGSRCSWSSPSSTCATLIVGIGLAGGRDRHLRGLPAPAGPRRSPRRSRSSRPSRSSSTRSSTSRCWWPSRTARYSPRGGGHGRSGSPRGAGAASTCWSRSRCRRTRRSTPRCPSRRPAPQA